MPPMSSSSSYDDPEGMLQDQGLEVVVIPYRPSPPPASRRVPTVPDAPPPNNNDAPEFMRSNSGGGHRKLVTPRSQLAMVEAVCQGDVGGTTDETRRMMPLHPLPPADRSCDHPREETANGCRSEAAPPPVDEGGMPTQTNNNPPNPSSRPKQSHTRRMSYLQLAKLGYQELVHAIIRPPRFSYTKEALGPERFTFCGAVVTRRDFTVWNKRRMRIQCSLWSCRDWCLEEETKDGRLKAEAGEDASSCVFNEKVVLDDGDESKERGMMYWQEVNEDEMGEIGSYSSSSSSLMSDCDERCSHAKKNDKSDDITASLSFSQCTMTQGEQSSIPHQPTKSSSSSSTTPPSSREKTRHPVVIYLHGNSSSRLEVIPQLGHLLSLGISILSFDFCGSGQSDGDYVSLGYHEREDLDSIIRYLRSTKQVSSIALWGRSMGAATALMYASRDPTISCMILDSPFTDLHRLIEEMVEKGRRHGVAVPNLVLQVVMRLLKSSVKSTAGFSLRHISPISHADKCFVPAMFVAGEHDNFIHKSHSVLIHHRYAGDKNIAIVDGDHNSPRPRYFQESACLFLQSVMGLPASGELVVPLGLNLSVPPWLLRNYKGLRSSASMMNGCETNSGHQRFRSPSRKAPKQEQRRKQSIQVEVLEQTEQTDCLNKRRKARLDCNETCQSPQEDDAPAAREDDNSASADTILVTGAPPDMNERQRSIQNSLFKMLGHY